VISKRQAKILHDSTDNAGDAAAHEIVHFLIWEAMGNPAGFSPDSEHAWIQS
jgi:hypothetical protein